MEGSQLGSMAFGGMVGMAARDALTSHLTPPLKLGVLLDRAADTTEAQAELGSAVAEAGQFQALKVMEPHLAATVPPAMS